MEITVPGYDGCVDPNAILKVEISEQPGQGTLVRLYLKSEKQPRVVEFATRQDALDFYETVWKLKTTAHARPTARKK